MTDETYNGYANYETWAVSLHLNNTQWLQEKAMRVVREARDGWGPNPLIRDVYENNPTTTARARANAAADAVQEYVREVLDRDVPQQRGDAIMSSAGALLASDLLGSALGRVEWREVAENLLEG